MGRDLPAVFNGAKSVKTAGRDSRGRFVAGAPAGPGRPRNPYARAQAALRAAVLDEVTEGDLRAVVRTVLRLAKRGSVPAAECVFKWIIGPPPMPVHPDQLDAHELQVRRAQPTLVDWLSLADEQADRAPADDGPAEEDLEVPAGEDEELPPAPLHPQLQAMRTWAIEQLAAAQPRAAIPPPNPQAGWERFAATWLAWDAQAAVPVDLLFVSYARWAAARGEPVLAEEQVLGWLTDHGASVTTGTYSQRRTVQGVRVVE